MEGLPVLLYNPQPEQPGILFSGCVSLRAVSFTMVDELALPGVLFFVLPFSSC
jgi:hypothetical protein